MEHQPFSHRKQKLPPSAAAYQPRGNRQAGEKREHYYCVLCNKMTKNARDIGEVLHKSREARMEGLRGRTDGLRHLAPSRLSSIWHR